MLHDIEACKSAGCDGVVLGMLMPEGRVDKTHVSADRKSLSMACVSPRL
jgi:copper homeostasis protein CutC